MFVKTKTTILDKKDYDRKVLLMKKLISYEFRELMRKYADKKGDLFVVAELSLEIGLFFEEKAEYL
ncbi:hypothetical protein COV13_01450 [Candidatus Woesearchaeota archaeon CG10_big_fil_rev_8_21_14_0_10_32_9]|nr:MAG: hypothetical protein COV13_01450 [Candidatus Woesearchaeota archaeon CG10_big_fil_rev_8_21_14_0_10_32_9]